MPVRTGIGWRPEIEVETAGPQPRFEVVSEAPGVHLVRVGLALPEPRVPEPITVSFRYPLTDVQGLWRPDFQPRRIFDRTLEPPWESFRTSATRGAPVVCAYAQSGENRITFAWSDASNPTTVQANVDEETGELLCGLTLFDLRSAPFARYEATLRLDTRPIAYYEALDAVRAWWEAVPEYKPARVPAAAREPVYSTWYSHHLAVSAEAVEKQCRLAKELGCGVVIVDDGWQTDTVDRGYSSCGDWRPAAAKFPDMLRHVMRVQALGLKYLLWFAVPFVGERSAAWSAFEAKLLPYEPAGWSGRWGVVDPRFPEVRQFLVSTYQEAAREWGIDGFKLDFIDEFQSSEQDRFGEGRDTDSIVDALEQVLTEVTGQLRERNPDVAIEFRQTYTGPLMRRFGNMLRAFDCPGDALENRVRTLTLRLLAGKTPVHSDMLMWSPEDGVASAALQLLNVLFAVPQISLRLDRLPAEHLEMVRFWLGFWREHRDVLLDGQLRPLHPDLNYPLVLAEHDEKVVAAAYGQELVGVEQLPAQAYLVNGTWRERLVLELLEPCERLVRVHDCTGRLQRELRARLDAGFTAIDVPRAGLVELTSGRRARRVRKFRRPRIRG
jgi:alpha-galactosidase